MASKKESHVHPGNLHCFLLQDSRAFIFKWMSWMQLGVMEPSLVDLVEFSPEKMTLIRPWKDSDSYTDYWFE